MIVTQATESRGQKNDALDALRLAEKLRAGTLGKTIFKAPRHFTVLRELARVHAMISRDLVRVQARLKSIYRSRGISTAGTRSVYATTKRAQWLAELPAAAQRAATRLYEQLDFVSALKDKAEAELVAESHKHAISRVLETVPGLGKVRVARLLPIVVTPHRFRTKRQFWSYCGLGIVMRSSSDWVRTAEGAWMRGHVQQTRGLTRFHNHTLKDIFKGAATTVVTFAGDDPIYLSYRRMTEAGTKPNLAKVSVARTIAAVTLRMWKNEEVYEPSRLIESQRLSRTAQS